MKLKSSDPLLAAVLFGAAGAAGIQRNKKHAEAAEYWRRYLANDAQSEWAARDWDKVRIQTRVS
jgi:hypothetical protein